MKMDKYNDMTLAKLVSLASNLQGIEREVITINPSNRCNKCKCTEC